MEAGQNLLHCRVLVTRPSYHPLLLPHNLYHHTYVGPAVQDYSTPIQCYLSHAATQTPFPLQLLQSPLFPLLYMHLCMALVWPLLATTPVVWTAAH